MKHIFTGQKAELICFCGNEFTQVSNKENKQLEIINSNICFFRDTMLQALRFCLTGAGSKMAEPLKKQASSSLLSMLGSQEETTRSAASACLGAMCGSLSDVDLTDVMISHLLGMELLLFTNVFYVCIIKSLF